MIFRSERRVDIPNITVTQNILTNPHNVPLDQPVLIDGSTGKAAYTFASLRQRILQLSYHLKHTLRLQRGNVVAIVLHNTVHFPAIVHGVLAAGGVVSSMNPEFTFEELAKLLGDGTAMSSYYR